jgi:hypothetical protein
MNELNAQSQLGQDIHVLHNIYKGKRHGYFVEIGAYDGVEYSNTYLMEKDYEWKGLLVECNPRWRSSIYLNRDCVFMPYAAYKEDNQILEFFDTGHGLSGLAETNQNRSVTTAPLIKVFTKKLTTMLDNARAPRFIEFLSIDTEGSEYEILLHHDFDKYIFGYICVEHNYLFENRFKIRNLLINKGYRLYRENKVDDDYIHSSLLTHT